MSSWDGLTHIDIEAQWPGLLDGSTPFDWYFRSPDGESYEAVVERATDWLSELQGNVIAISHGLVGRIIRGTYLGLSKDDALGLPVPSDRASEPDVRSLATTEPRTTGIKFPNRQSEWPDCWGVASRAISTLRSRLNFARRLGLIEVSPAAGVRIMASQKLKRHLNAGEIRHMGKVMMQIECEGEHPMAIAAIAVGQLT